MQSCTSNIKDLGELNGEVLVFGGPYSNLHATKAMFQIAKSKNIAPSNRICTGDVVGYCGNPKETLDLIKGQCEWLAGNCEKQLSVMADSCGCGFEAGSVCDLLSRGWYAFASSVISTNQRKEMATCPDLIVFNHLGKRYSVIHGGFTERSNFIFSTTDEAVFKKEINAIEAVIGKIDVVIAGHSGIAFQRLIGRITWLNAGVIGMPENKGIQSTKYLILTDDGPETRPLFYDVKAAISVMRDAGLIQGYEISLESGFWPSQDILPQELRR